jgi:putative membrane protein
LLVAYQTIMRFESFGNGAQSCLLGHVFPGWHETWQPRRRASGASRVEDLSHRVCRRLDLHWGGVHRPRRRVKFTQPKRRLVNVPGAIAFAFREFSPRIGAFMIARTTRFALLAGLTALSLTACQTAEKAATTVKSTAQAQMNPTLSTSDATFMNTAAGAGIAEVNFGQLAESKATSTAIRRFATQMVSDHTAANSKLAALAQTKQITLPTDMDMVHRQAYEQLQQAHGRAFNKLYMDGQVQDHMQVVQAFQTEAQNGTDPDVKAFAQQMLPTLQNHLEMAQKLDPKS